MKKFSTIILISIVALMLWTGEIYSQDAVKVDPKHYKVELENDFVRVLKINYAPGEQSVMHTHPKGVAVFLTNYDAQFILASGEKVPVSGEKGEVRWNDKFMHLPSNTGSEQMELILVELKDDGTSSFDIETAKAAIDERNREFIDLVSQKDAAGLSQLYTTDGQFMGTNMSSSKGREAIQATFQNYLNSGVARIELQNLDIWGDEEMLVTEDAWQIFLEDGTEIDRGKAIVMWKKEDGTWKMFRDMINSDLPMPKTD